MKCSVTINDVMLCMMYNKIIFFVTEYTNSDDENDENDQNFTDYDYCIGSTEMCTSDEDSN